MNIAEFASRYRLKLTKDECGDSIIAGRIGSSTIYEYDNTCLGVMFITDSPRTGLWKKFQAVCLTAGMKPCQCGDAEGSFMFDPENQEQAKVAIKGIRAKTKRKVSPELAAAGAARLLAARQARNSGLQPQQEAIS